MDDLTNKITRSLGKPTSRRGFLGQLRKSFLLGLGVMAGGGGALLTATGLALASCCGFNGSPGYCVTNACPTNPDTSDTYCANPGPYLPYYCCQANGSGGYTYWACITCCTRDTFPYCYYATPTGTNCSEAPVR